MLPPSTIYFSDEEVRQRSRDLLQSATANGLDAAEIDICFNTGYSVSARLGQLDMLEQKNEQGLTLTVYNNNSTASVSTTDFTQSSLDALLEKAKSLVSCTQEDPFCGLAEKSQLAYRYPDLDLFHDWHLAASDAIELAVRMDAAACAFDSRVVSCDSCDVSTSIVHCYYANTHDFLGYYPYSIHHISCSVLAQDQGGKQQYSDYDACCVPNELNDVVWLAETVAEKTCQRLSPRKIKSQQCPVLFAAPVARGLLSCFLAAINGHSIYRESSFLCGALGEQIFPEFVSLFQRPHEERVLHSAPFDDEGVITRDFAVLEQGRFNQYICDSYSARKLGCAPTGTAGGLHNVIASHSNCSLRELFQKMHTGFFVTELMGQGINLLTGDYSRGASGFWIENGEIQFPVAEVTVAGNLREMFSQIIAIGNDIDRRGNIKVGSILLERMMIAGGQ